MWRTSGKHTGKAVLFALAWATSSALAQTLPLPSDLIAFNSSEGENLLLKSEARNDFWNLSTQFVTQSNPAYCGVASMVMVLNSLGVPAPEWYAGYRVFTQENFFDNENATAALDPMWSSARA